MYLQGEGASRGYGIQKWFVHLNCHQVSGGEKRGEERGEERWGGRGGGGRDGERERERGTGGREGGGQPRVWHSEVVRPFELSSGMRRGEEGREEMGRRGKRDREGEGEERGREREGGGGREGASRGYGIQKWFVHLNCHQV